MKNRKCITDHGIQTDFHPPCEKDLRVSYLEQYEINASPFGKNIDEEIQMGKYEMSKAVSRNSLKDITDKYGFFWDQRGRLMKRSDNYLLKRPKKHQPKSPKINESPIKQRVQKNEIKLKTTHDESYFFNDNQCSEIDIKIDRIVRKYSPIKKNQQNGANKDKNFSILKDVKNKNNFSMPKSSSIGSLDVKKKIQCKINDEKQAQYGKADILELKRQKRGIKGKVFSFSKEKQNEVSFRKKQNEEIKNVDEKQEEIDKKIRSITMKIKQCQKQKQNLHIQFKKFDENCVSRSKSPIKNRQSLTKNREVFQKKEHLKTQDNNNNDKKLEIMNENKKVQIMNKYERFLKQKFRFNSAQIQITDKKQGNNEKQVNFNQQGDKKKILIIQKQQLPNESQKKQLGKLVKVLCKQIQLDEELRNSKIWFQNNDDPHKWGILADKLARQGAQYKYRDLVEKFSSTTEEHNPFFSIKQNNESYMTLISKQRQAEQHWNKEILHRFSTEDFQSINFTNRELDIENKGFVKVEDLVRFFNMRANIFYRSRDLCLIFTRIAGKDKKQVHFSQILRVLSSQDN